MKSISAVNTGIAGGNHVVNGPLTIGTIGADSQLLRNEIDNRVVKIRPMSTPIDQISRSACARPVGSIKAEFFSVDTKKTSTKIKVNADIEDAGGNDEFTIKLKVEDPLIFAQTETGMIPGVKNESGEQLIFYVLSETSDGPVEIRLLNSKVTPDIISELKVNTTLVRMGRAATELDVQTSQFQALPKADFNYCQIFKAQVEQSTFMKIRNKEVGWSFSDQEEVAIIDMRLGMEKNFLFGNRNHFIDPVKQDEVYFTGGIWNQAGKEAKYSRGNLTAEKVVAIMKEAFTGNGGSSRKILVAGSGLIEALNVLEYNRTITAGETVTKWGIDFHEIISKFGTLYVIHSEVFDECGHADDGLIFDPEYLTKYVHVPFRTERIDLKASGVRNTEAIVVTEVSCLVLRYPSAHCRVVAEN